jgi:hypothetical protein
VPSALRMNIEVLRARSIADAVLTEQAVRV